MIPLTETTFRRLARSAPWRFTCLHLSWTPADTTFSPVEAWLTRPGHLEVRLPNGERHRVQERSPAAANGIESGRDEHGLVLERGPAYEGRFDDPMWQTYTWVAMLDPVELATGTTVTELTETERFGRRTWWATMAALEGEYEPRCGCCPLLWGEVSERAELSAGGPAWVREHPEVEYPQAWLVGLDVETGVVVSTTPLGGSRPDAGFSMTIHEAS